MRPSVLTCRFLLTVLLTAPILRGLQEKGAVVRLYAVDQRGHGISPIEVVRFVEQRLGGRDYAQSFAGAEASDIPHGDYVAHLKSANRRIAGIVHVNADHVFVVLSAHDKITEYPPGAAPTLSGRLTGLQRKTPPVWVRLINAYEDAGCCRTLEVTEEGTFSTKGLEPGTYLLIVLNDAGILQNGSFYIEDPSSEIDVDVKSGMIKVNRR